MDIVRFRRASVCTLELMIVDTMLVKQVSNNPAPVRRRSALIIRHSSLSPHRLPPQKYKHTSDKPKVPLFMDKENAFGVLRTEVIITPRENPRDWVHPTVEFPLGADSSLGCMTETKLVGFCCRVKDFVVGRHEYESIKFLGETDVRKLDLDSAVQFNHREVIIYLDESQKPPVGQGLNKPAEITLLNVKMHQQIDCKGVQRWSSGRAVEI